MPLCFHKAQNQISQRQRLEKSGRVTVAEQLDISPSIISYVQTKEAVQCTDQCEAAVEANLHEILFLRDVINQK